MTMENGTMESWESSAMIIGQLQSRIQALEADLATALIEVSNQARLRGEAEGKLHVSELAGIVEGWQLRAERAEAEVREAWNEAQCCDDTPLGQATLAEFIAEQHKCRKSAEAELAEAIERAERWKDTAGAEAEAFEEQKAQTKRAEAELARKTGALERQSDNMAFVINNVGLPDVWVKKFMRELDEDRAISARSALEEKTDV